MGARLMGRRGFHAYSDDDWRAATRDLETILRNRWPVYADCDACGLRIKADLERIAQVVGAKRSLWSAKPRCRRVGCIGRVTFYVEVPGKTTAIAMTAKR